MALLLPGKRRDPVPRPTQHGADEEDEEEEQGPRCRKRPEQEANLNSADVLNDEQEYQTGHDGAQDQLSIHGISTDHIHGGSAPARSLQFAPNLR